MQDRHKFRYHNNNKIYDVSAIDFTRSRGEIVSLDKMETLMCKLDLNNLIQCTGLRDKNGKLIYQEDIVRDTSTQTVYKVSHKKCAFYLENEEYIGYFHELSQCFSISRLEVIGNIYENPDLLKKSPRF